MPYLLGAMGLAVAIVAGGLRWREGLPPLLALHGALMLAVWAALLPAGAIIARYCKVTPGQRFPTELDNQAWWDWHRRCQYAGAALSVLGLGAVLGVTGASFGTPHGWLGLGLIGLCVAQVIGAALRGTKGGPTDPAGNAHDPATWRGDHFDMTPRRRRFEHAHRALGWALLAVGAWVVLLGHGLIGAPDWLLIVIFGSYAALLLVIIEHMHGRRRVDTYVAIWGPHLRSPLLDATPPGDAPSPAATRRPAPVIPRITDMRSTPSPLIRRLGAACLGLLGLGLPAAPARAWPDRPVTIVAPFGPGTSQDVLARLLAPRLQAAWGQSVIVNNVVGAAGTIGVDRVAKAAPDGTTLVLSGDAAIVVRVSMSPRPPYDPQRDLAPVVLLGRTPNLLVVSNANPARSVADLLAAARARPGTMTFAHAGTGTSQHIGGELLAQLGGVELTAVAYNDPAAQILDVQNGRVTMGFQSGVVALPRLRDGTWRALAVSSTTRMSVVPDLPTVAESGLPGFDATAWLAIFAPAATPEPVVAQVARDMVAAMAVPELRARMTDLGIEYAGGGPAELRDLVAREIPRMAGVLQRAGVRPE